ncbi:ATP-binding protein [Paenibacillus sp. CN-4]|uniref:ATP-binding protein n=1 Tax=Paenibacillus nanchangensis TaxID=3348343 RepID=UPI00397BA5A8
MTTSLFADSEYEGTYSCVGCRQTIGRTYIPINKKWGLKPACPCVVAEREREEKEQERKIRRAKMERIYARSIMNEALKQATFYNFTQRSGTERVCKAAGDFVRRFEGRKTGLLFHGKPGNGKSHLAAAISHELDRRGWVCLFLDVPQLFNLAKDSNRSGSKVSLTDIINGAIAADLLTLDELGSGYLTEYEFNDILFPILNGRQGKPTNFTTNLDLRRLQRWFEKDKEGRPLDEDGRIYDRILGSTDIYENQASSKRREDAMLRMNGGR